MDPRVQPALPVLRPQQIQRIARAVAPPANLPPLHQIWVTFP